MSEGSHPVERSVNRWKRYEDDAVIFYKEDNRYQNRPQNVIASAHDVELRRGFEDHGSSLTICYFQHSGQW